MKISALQFHYAGNVSSLVYPTPRIVNYTFDAADRPSTAIDGSNGITYATGFKTSPGGTCIANVTCYTPQGTFYALSIGQSSAFTNGLNLTHFYNSRLQPQEFKASSSGGNAIDISYSFVDPVSGHNAGHVFGITNNILGARSQTFTYDQLNRIISAQTTSTYATGPTFCWGETYQYDGVANGAWGNLTQIAATTNSAYTGCTQESGFTKTADGNNHLSGFSYDLSGNATGDGVNSYTWDAESQLTVTAGSTYVYDGDGRRVAKANTANPPVPYKLYWYGSGGEILAETDGAGNTNNSSFNEYIFFGGKRVAMITNSGNPTYYVEDLLGTSRVLTTNTGVVCYDADFYPFGVERPPYTNTCQQNNYKFEGKERDTETGNDDFGARYYSNRFGRWLSADWSNVPVPVPYANLTNPQTLNLYSMVADDPESFADLDGHFLNYGRNVTGYYIDADCFGSPDWKCFLQANANDGNSQSQQAAQNQQQQTQAQNQNPANMTTGQFLKEEVKGVADATVMPVVNMVTHPIDTIHQAFEGFSLLATSPVSTVKEAGSQAITEIKQTVSSALAGNPRAIGQVVGTAAAAAYTYSSARSYAPTSKGGPGGFGMNFQLTSKNFVRFDIHRLHFGGQAHNLVPHIDFRLGPLSGVHWPW